MVNVLWILPRRSRRASESDEIAIAQSAVTVLSKSNAVDLPQVQLRSPDVGRTTITHEGSVCREISNLNAGTFVIAAIPSNLAMNVA